ALDESLRQAEALLVQPSAEGPAPRGQDAPPPPVFGPEALPPIARALEPLAQLSPPNPDDPAVPAFETAHLTHQLRQIIRTVQRVREDAYAVQDAPDTRPAVSARGAEPV